MNGSALVGLPPASQNDWYIVRGFYRGYEVPNTNPDIGIPLLAAPPGAPQGQTRGPQTIAAYSVLIFLLLTITSVRLALRFFKKDLRWGLDDYAIIFGASGAITWLAIAIAMVLVGGAGRHIYDITYEELNRFIDLAAGETMLFYISVGLIKVSITLFNRRLTGLISKPWMIYHNILLVLIVSFIITSIFVQVFKCLPVLHSWGFLGYGEPAQPVKCITINTYSLALNVTHVILDFALLSVPVIVFCKMKMSKSKRIRLIFLFSIGAVSVIGSVNRQIITQQNALDVTWESSQGEMWTVIDLFFGCIAASLPVLNSLIPRRWRSPSVSVPTFVSEDRHRFAQQSNDRRVDKYGDDYSFTNSSVTNEPQFHSEATLNDSGETLNNHSLGEKDSYEDAYADGTVREPREPPRAMSPRDSGWV